MPTSSYPSVASLQRAVEIAEQIQSLQSQLASLVGGGATVAEPTPRAAGKRGPGRPKGKRTMSTEAREKIAAAQRARWAKSKGAAKAPAVAAAKPGRKKRAGLTPAGRARLAAAMKARWAARKKGAPAPNAAKK